MKAYKWQELFKLAKAKSPYYAELYAGIEEVESLSRLPITEQSEFWKANTVKNNRVLTSSNLEGIVFKSGGTTGNPKFSVYSREEWQAFCDYFGEGMSRFGLSAFDRVANLFYVGELYASFIFIMNCIEAAPQAVLQFPIGGACDPEQILKNVEEFEINVIAALPTTIMNLAEFYAAHKSKFQGIKIKKILFGGESMYPDQRKRLFEIFGELSIISIGYASVDAGLIGYADQSCLEGEHRVFSKASILEIVDEDSLEPIYEVNRPGKILLTNLIRSLMPIIRYPVGDRGIWTEDESENRDRKYMILGRSEEAARVGPVSVYYEDMRAFLQSLELEFEICAFQLLIKHFDLKDALILRLSITNDEIDFGSVEKLISARFAAERLMFAEAIAAHKVHPLFVEWVSPGEIEINSRTGKLRRVIDERF
ncbi:MAG: AMP-binding protein [Candidatus Obscuribacterales bacterium]|nr:AMP-binding protein [Candidatus Obscuribacterales bacterium]